MLQQVMLISRLKSIFSVVVRISEGITKRVTMLRPMS